MNKPLFSLALALLIALPAFAQEADSSKGFRPFVRIGSSLTYIWNNENNGIHHEYTLNLNASLALSPRWSAGASVLRIWTRRDLSPKNQYVMAGLFGQYNITIDPKVRLYPETGIYRGNYCTCGDVDPYRSSNIWYWSMGGGASFALRQNLHFEVGFVNYQILSRITDKYNYTQYIIGLEYHLGENRQKKERNPKARS
jgi:hypothetical protein